MNISRINMNEISFRGKNPNQFISIAPEHGGLKAAGLNNYAAGGLACVSQEAPENWTQQYKNCDIRSCVPYHAPNNPQGKMIVAKLKEDDHIVQDGGLPTIKKCLPKTVAEKDLKYVDASSYSLKKGEFFVVLNGDKESNGRYKYAVLEDTGIKGKVKALKEVALEVEEVPYRIFKMPGVEGKKEAKYFVHTPQMAVLPKAYGKDLAYRPGQIIDNWYDLYYANFNRAIVDAMPKLAEKEGFNPANVWMHDRPAFIVQQEIARRSSQGESFFNGLKMHSTFHNPGYDYQGYYDDPLGFIRIAFDEKDFEKLKKSGDFYELLDIERRRHGNLPEADKKRVSDILKPYYSKFIDDNGKPNISMTPVANVKTNGMNASAGTVSCNYGKEMKERKGIASGMTDKLKSIPTIDITNGNTPSNLGIEKISNFGIGDNTLSERNKTYTPYKPIIDPKTKQVVNFSAPKGTMFKPDGTTIDAESVKTIRETAAKKMKSFQATSLRLVKKYLKTKERIKKTTDQTALAKLTENLKKYTDAMAKNIEKSKPYRNSDFGFSVKEAKERNKKWLLDIIGSCVDKDGNVDKLALNKVFFNASQISPKNKYNVIGYVSKFSEGDKIYTSWGRPDPQKGFSTLLQGFYKFLTDESVPLEKRVHSKLILGSGKGPWKPTEADYKVISEYVDKIRKMNNGQFFGNVCYVDGLFPNKLIACSDWGIFTSRFEPCGITPLESFSSGTPVLSIRTGGAPDFIVDYTDEKSLPKANGIMTKDPFMLNPEELGISDKGIDKKDFEILLDEKRREKLSDEVSDMFKKASTMNDETYDTLAKNACVQNVEWHTNSTYNGGKTANQRYMGEVFELDDKLQYAKGRNEAPMTKLTGTFGDTSKTKVVIAENPVTKNIKEVAAEAEDKIVGSSFTKKLLKDKRTYWAVGSLAVVAGIAAYALNRDSHEKASKVKPVNIGTSTIYFG